MEISSFVSPQQIRQPELGGFLSKLLKSHEQPLARRELDHRRRQSGLLNGTQRVQRAQFGTAEVVAGLHVCPNLRPDLRPPAGSTSAWGSAFVSRYLCAGGFLKLAFACVIACL
jgi:hypothetical protein